LEQNKCSAVAAMSDRLATIDIRAEKRGLSPFWDGGVGSPSTIPSNTMRPRPRPTSVLSGILIHPAFGHNRHGPKIVGMCPLFGGAGSPSNTKSPWPRPTSLPSGILIHLAIWPQRKKAENSAAVPPLGELDSNL